MQQRLARESSELLAACIIDMLDLTSEPERESSRALDRHTHLERLQVRVAVEILGLAAWVRCLPLTCIRIVPVRR